MIFRPVLQMKQMLIILCLLNTGSPLLAQKVDSISFHLYTDSLRKGQHNYINVDGKLSTGRWVPMTANEVRFSCTTASFEGNELILPESFTDKFVTVKAELKNDPAIWIEKKIWIRQNPDGPLPTKEEIMKKIKQKKRN